MDVNGANCKIYETACEFGRFKHGFESLAGPGHNYPEKNCCVCGKSIVFFCFFVILRKLTALPF